MNPRMERAKQIMEMKNHTSQIVSENKFKEGLKLILPNPTLY